MRVINDIFGINHNVGNITKKGKCICARIDDTDVIIKKKNDNNVINSYNYLESRGFSYFPKIIYDDANYYVYQYIKNIDIPYDQRAFDLMLLLSLIHNKTTYYKQMDIDEYKKIYEDIIEQINTTYDYYNNLINIIESHVYMSPSEYLIARNISKIYGALLYSKNKIDEWFEIIKATSKKREVLLYNNIDINHVIRNKDLYLINFEKSKFGIPIYDLYNFYIKYSNSFDFLDLLQYYEAKYPLLKEEKMLFFVLISIPKIVKMDNSELDNCKRVKYMIDLLYKSEVLTSENEKERNTE